MYLSVSEKCITVCSFKQDTFFVLNWITTINNLSLAKVLHHKHHHKCGLWYQRHVLCPTTTHWYWTYSERENVSIIHFFFVLHYPNFRSSLMLTWNISKVNIIDTYIVNWTQSFTACVICTVLIALQWFLCCSVDGVWLWCKALWLWLCPSSTVLWCGPVGALLDSMIV